MTRKNQTAPEEVVQRILNLERAALDRWGKGDPSGFLEISAPDVVYFDPGLERRIDGREALSKYYGSIRGTVFFERYELLNPFVQQIGDAAVLTFNYVSYSGDNKGSRWNCTEVFRRSGEEWQIIQTHWSYTIAVRPT